METLKNIMGSAFKEDITLEDVDKFFANGKFVNLNSGEYVAKGKYDELKSKYETLKTDHETYKEQTKDYETIKADNEKYVAEKADNELKAKLVKYGIDEKSVAYVKSDVASKVLNLDDPKTEEANVKAYLKEHPMFAHQEAPKQKIVVSTKASDENAGAQKQTQTEKNASINTGLRDILGIGEK